MPGKTYSAQLQDPSPARAAGREAGEGSWSRKATRAVAFLVGGERRARQGGVFIPCQPAHQNQPVTTRWLKLLTHG